MDKYVRNADDIIILGWVYISMYYQTALNIFMYMFFFFLLLFSLERNEIGNVLVSKITHAFTPSHAHLKTLDASFNNNQGKKGSLKQLILNLRRAPF